MFQSDFPSDAGRRGGRRRDDDDGLPFGLIFGVIFFLLIAGLAAWWWFSRDRSPAPEPTQVVEQVPAPVAVPEPEPVPVDVPAPAPTPAPIEEPAPTPPPPAEPVRMTVYFELMSAELTADARRMISAGVAGTDIASATSIRVEGFTDTAGAPDYNLPLSRRRAAAVAAALQSEAEGFPQSALDTGWFGETRLATPTADGVREPLNRRATIEIRFD